VQKQPKIGTFLKLDKLEHFYSVFGIGTIEDHKNCGHSFNLQQKKEKQMQKKKCKKTIILHP
jgi:hypothetical protein